VFICFKHHFSRGIHDGDYVIWRVYCGNILIWAYIATIYPPDYIITIMVEFLLKNGADPCPYHTLPQYTLWIT